MPEPISRQAALDHIRDHYGERITVEFVKRSTGQLRRMTFEQGVSGDKAPTRSAPYVFGDKQLLPVFDTEERKFKSVPIDGLTGIEINGEWFSVE